MKRMDIIGQLIAKNVELLKQSQPQRKSMKNLTLLQKRTQMTLNMWMTTLMKQLKKQLKQLQMKTKI